MTDTDSLAPEAASPATPAAFQRPPGKLTTAQAVQQLAESQAAVVAALPQLAAALPQMMAQAFGSVLQQVQVLTRQHFCCQCLAARIGWENQYEPQMKAAGEKAAAAAGMPEGDPRRAQLDITQYLPEHLRPGASAGMPPLNVAVTTVNGSEVCPLHIPGRPGSRQLLIATGALSPAALASLSVG